MMVLASTLVAGASARAEDWSIHGGYELLVVVPEQLAINQYLSPARYPIPNGREYPSGVLTLEVDDHPVSWLKLHTQSLFDTDGTALNTQGGVYNYSDVFQHKLYGGKFEEGYADANLGEVDARIGVQKFTWGKLDSLAPNDGLLNPLENYNPLLAGLAGIRDSEIGIPAVRLGYYPTFSQGRWMPDEGSAEVIWEPFYVPTRVDNIDERWFPPNIAPSSRFTTASTSVNVNVATQNEPPPARLNQPTLGGRLSGTRGKIDVDLYYYYGYQTAYAAVGNLTVGKTASTADVLLRPIFRRLQSIGMATATQLGPFGVRAEVALQKDAFFAKNLNSITVTADGLPPTPAPGQTFRLSIPPLDITSNVARYGFSADYATHGYVFIAQINENDMQRNVPNLINPRHETIPTFIAQKTLMDGRLEATISGLYSIQAGYSLLEPMLKYTINDHWSVTMGYLKIAGPQNSYLGQFHNNDEVFTKISYVF